MPEPAFGAPPPATVAAKRLNPYNRDLELTVPLNYQDKVVGEIAILLTKDDRLAVYRPGFRTLLSGMLNAEGLASLDQKLGREDPFFADDLTGTGIALKFDPSSLSVAILSIDPKILKATSLFDKAEQAPEKLDLLPTKFAGYVNFNLAQSYSWQTRGAPRLGPSAAINGAIRYGAFVLEGSGQLSDDPGSTVRAGGYKFDRDYLRLVYDQPEQYRRWQAGDLFPEIRGQQGYAQLAGIGVTRQRRRFNLDRTAILQANRQIVLQNASTVSIYRNGVLFRQDKLAAGPYDLSQLPLLAGGNDIKIEVRDDAGRIQNIQYSSYSDPIDLVPGDYEYGAYLGVIADTFGGSPHYSRDVAFTGYFRKAFLDKPSIGFGLQATKQVQQLTGQTQFYLWSGSRLQTDFGISHSKIGKTGYSAAIEFNKTLNRNELVDSFVLRADYTSRRFTGIGAPDPDNSTVFTANIQYTHAINQRLYVTGTASYLTQRGNRSDAYRFGLTSSYRLNRSWSVRAGADYSRFATGGSRQNGFGGTISLVFQPHARDRAEARYESGTENTSLSYSHSGSGRLGSVDYGVLAQRDPDFTNVEGYAQFSANRFDASFSQSTYGDGIRSVGDNQVSTVQIGTSLAFADGHVALSRRISDSFAILYPHSSLRGHSVVAGQSLEPGDFISRSGTLGGAVNNYLASYVDQSITYDVEDPPVGYDIGPGTYRVRPAYRSGYTIQVGTDAFVSAVGTLLAPDGKPASLVAGSVVTLGRPGEKPMPFFSNSVGRFAVQNLRPGGQYRVDLAQGFGSFAMTVPKDTGGLLQLGQIKVVQGDAK